MRPSPWALLPFLLYLSGSLLFGEHFPFSRYDMYADIPRRDRGAIPIFLADGQPSEPTEFLSFYGISAENVRAPLGVACTMGYIVEERLARILAAPAERPGPVRIQVGFDRVRLEEGKLIHDFWITGEGSAWPH